VGKEEREQINEPLVQAARKRERIVGKSRGEGKRL